jgi:hypothetical protein
MDTEPAPTPFLALKKLEPLAIVSLALWFPGFCAGVAVWLPIDVMEHLPDQTIEGIYIGVGILAWIPSIVCAHVSLSRIRTSTVLKGRGFAFTGLTIS